MTNVLNTKVLLSAGIIVAMTAAALGATYAAWTASSNITGNTVSTANVSITAAGASGSGGAQPLPFSETGFVPGAISTPEERATVTNNGDIPMNLYMYVDDVFGIACSGIKLAWQSSTAGGGPVWYGYPVGPTPTNPGTIAGAGDTNFTILSGLTGIANKVLISDAANFEAGDVIAMRQIAGLATDTPYPGPGATCSWTLYFVAETV